MEYVPRRCPSCSTAGSGRHAPAPRPFRAADRHAVPRRDHATAGHHLIGAGRVRAGTSRPWPPPRARRWRSPVNPAGPRAPEGLAPRAWPRAARSGRVRRLGRAVARRAGRPRPPTPPGGDARGRHHRFRHHITVDPPSMEITLLCSVRGCRLPLARRAAPHMPARAFLRRGPSRYVNLLQPRTADRPGGRFRRRGRGATALPVRRLRGRAHPRDRRLTAPHPG